MLFQKARFNGLLVALSILLFSLSGCVLNDEPGKLPPKCGDTQIQNLQVNTLERSGDYLFAATEKGVYRTRLDQGKNPEWKCTGLGDASVTALTRLPEGRLLAGIKAKNAPSDATLYRSSPGGTKWQSWQNGFGGSNNHRTVRALVSLDQDPSLVYARGSRHVARSTDGGRSWQVIYGDWNSTGYQAPLIKIDPHNSDRLWAGGESSIFSPYLVTSADNGRSWEDRGPSTNGDNAVYSLAFHPTETEHLLLGIEGRILKSTNRGKEWTTAYQNEDYPYILTMATPGGQPSDTVYASGTAHGTSGGNLYLLQSLDFGRHWQRTVVIQAGEGQAVNDMLAIQAGERVVIYMATQQGVVTYRM